MGQLRQPPPAPPGDLETVHTALRPGDPTRRQPHGRAGVSRRRAGRSSSRAHWPGGGGQTPQALGPRPNCEVAVARLSRGPRRGPAAFALVAPAGVALPIGGGLGGAGGCRRSAPAGPLGRGAALATPASAGLACAGVPEGTSPPGRQEVRSPAAKGAARRDVTFSGSSGSSAGVGTRCAHGAPHRVREAAGLVVAEAARGGTCRASSAGHPPAAGRWRCVRPQACEADPQEPFILQTATAPLKH